MGGSRSGAQHRPDSLRATLINNKCCDWLVRNNIECLSSEHSTTRCGERSPLLLNGLTRMATLTLSLMVVTSAQVTLACGLCMVSGRWCEWWSRWDTDKDGSAHDAQHTNTRFHCYCGSQLSDVSRLWCNGCALRTARHSVLRHRRHRQDWALTLWATAGSADQRSGSVRHNTSAHHSTALSLHRYTPITWSITDCFHCSDCSTPVVVTAKLVRRSAEPATKKLGHIHTWNDTALAEALLVSMCGTKVDQGQSIVQLA